MPAGYSGTPLFAKLGIGPAMTVTVLGAPDGFDELLVGRPDDVVLRSRLRSGVGLVISFQVERSVLERRLPRVLEAMALDGALWVAWPKKASKVRTDLTEDVVRDVVLPLGLVDVKVCAIDQTWSGLKVVWRKERR